MSNPPNTDRIIPYSPAAKRGDDATLSHQIDFNRGPFTPTYKDLAKSDAVIIDSFQKAKSWFGVHTLIGAAIGIGAVGSVLSINVIDGLDNQAATSAPSAIERTPVNNGPSADDKKAIIELIDSGTPDNPIKTPIVNAKAFNALRR